MDNTLNSLLQTVKNKLEEEFCYKSKINGEIVIKASIEDWNKVWADIIKA